MDSTEKKIILALLIVVVLGASFNSFAFFTGTTALCTAFGIIFGAVAVASLAAIPFALKHAQ